MLNNLSAKMMAHMTERSQEAGEDTGRWRNWIKTRERSKERQTRKCGKISGKWIGKKEKRERRSSRSEGKSRTSIARRFCMVARMRINRPGSCGLWYRVCRT